jgi:hypothetical protein
LPGAGEPGSWADSFERHIMCYVCFIAINKQLDLEKFHSEYLITEFINYHHPQLDKNWFTMDCIYVLGSKSTASCDFRNWESSAGFQLPQEWALENEKDEKISGARQLYDMFEYITKFSPIELVLKWWDENLINNNFILVNINAVKRNEFTLFNDCKMRIISDK